MLKRTEAIAMMETYQESLLVILTHLFFGKSLTKSEQSELSQRGKVLKIIEHDNNSI